LILPAVGWHIGELATEFFRYRRPLRLLIGKAAIGAECQQRLRFLAFQAAHFGNRAACANAVIELGLTLEIGFQPDVILLGYDLAFPIGSQFHVFQTHRPTACAD
jgi:hypothetical protein